MGAEPGEVEQGGEAARYEVIDIICLSLWRSLSIIPCLALGLASIFSILLCEDTLVVCSILSIFSNIGRTY
jgi:uncharacterized membrane protein